jgi:hypothetical protein
MALFPVSTGSSLQKTNDIRYLYKKNPILATTSWRSPPSGAYDGLFPVSTCSSLQKTNDIRYLYKKNPILATTSWRSSASGAYDGFVASQHLFFPSKNERHKVPLQEESYSGNHIFAIVCFRSIRWLCFQSALVLPFKKRRT